MRLIDASVAGELTRLTGLELSPEPAERVAGGSINRCYRWPSRSGPIFVKVAESAASSMLEAEAAGLAELARAHAVRVPRVLACGRSGASAFLALEWLEAGAATGESEECLGAGLAAQHAVTAPEHGWRRDNTIGRTPQANGPTASWAEFFRERRLRPQLELAMANGFGPLLEAPGERLLAGVGALLATHRPEASLLHGDLWGGNWLATRDGDPVIFDPAVYYGDRETDLAMTQLFGGFGARFYRAYGGAAPLPHGAELRLDLYNLYHVLNHANLFGESYAHRALAMIQRLLAELHG
ncbi:MAG TPA: fructosamine kinase family protein [Steroidobacteraceae bacterium]|nr:fructosamine kinase family protein [Steroidobacteraceae bacterium]